MADEWYYAKGKEKVGPLTAAQFHELVRSGEVSRTSMVWKTGWEKWAAAGQVKGLFDEAPGPTVQGTSSPPPLPEQPDQPVPVESGGPGANLLRLPLILGICLCVSLLLTCVAPAVLSGPSKKRESWGMDFEESRRQRRQEAPARIALSVLLFVDAGLAVALGLLLFNAYRERNAASPGRSHEPVWWRLWRMKTAFFGLLLVWLLLLCSGVSAAEDVLPSALGNVLLAFYTLLMLGLAVTTGVFGFRALNRRVNNDVRRSMLWGKWEPVSGEGCSLWFYDDGGFLRSDGFGAKFDFDADKHTILVNVDGFGERIPLQVITITQHELILGCGGQALHFKKGKTITDERWEASVEKSKEFLKQAALVTGAVAVGVVGLGVLVLGAAAVAAGGVVAGAAAGGGGYGDPSGGYDGGYGGHSGGGLSGSGERSEPAAVGSSPQRTPDKRTGGPAPTAGGRQRKVAGVRGVVIVGDDGGLVTYKKKCEKCGHVEPGTTRMAISSGNTRSSFMCSHCKQMQETDIQATS